MNPDQIAIMLGLAPQKFSIGDYANQNRAAGAAPATGFGSLGSGTYQLPTGNNSITNSVLPGGTEATGGLWDSMKDIPLGSIISGIGTLGNLWGSSRALGLARDQFNFQKDFANTNLTNQIKSYNTALEDRARTRAAVEGQSQDSAQSYIDRNRLSR